MPLITRTTSPWRISVMVVKFRTSQKPKSPWITFPHMFLFNTPSIILSRITFAPASPNATCSKPANRKIAFSTMRVSHVELNLVSFLFRGASGSCASDPISSIIRSIGMMMSYCRIVCIMSVAPPTTRMDVQQRKIDTIELRRTRRWMSRCISALLPSPSSSAVGSAVGLIAIIIAEGGLYRRLSAADLEPCTVWSCSSRKAMSKPWS
mmetsp:Transcript_60230/g.123726  ORF Transcript_60230/g.123726 Transcript_60230/m.123726 type:complete len:208 (-) Transcript_60230:1470-2093(-)